MFILDDWYISGTKNSIKVADENGEKKLVISITDSSPVYLTYKRNNVNFSVEPEESSLQVIANGWVSVSANIVHEFSANPMIGISQYQENISGESSREQSWGTSSKLIFHTSDKNNTNSLYFRFDKPGVYQLSDLLVDTGMINIIDDKISFDIDDLNPNTDSVKFTFDAISNLDDDSSALISMEWTGENDRRIPGLPDHAVHPQYGPYEYVRKDALNEFQFRVPFGAINGKLKFIPWKSGSPIFIRKNWTIELVKRETEIQESPSAKLRNIICSIPSDKNIVVLHTTAPPLGHSTLSLRPNRLAVEFENRGYYVIFLPFSVIPEGTKQYGENSLVVCRSLWPVLQFELAKRKSGKNVMVCTSFPNFEAMSAVDLLGMAGWSTVYEIRDDMEEFNRVGYSKWFNVQLEQYVAERAGKVLAVSPRLAKKANILAKRDDAIVSPNAVSDLLYENGRSHRTLEFQKSKVGSKTIGYLGHLTDSWFDWRTLISAAVKLPEYKFRIIGHGIPKRLQDNLPKNMVYLGPMAHEDFIEESKNWAVGLIPFKISPLTFGVDPNKLYEYLALGIRVVSAPMGSVESAPMTSVYRDVDELHLQIVEQAAREATSEELVRLEEFLKKSKWDYRAGQIVDIFNEANNAN